MDLNFFSLVMAVLWSSLFICLLSILRKNVFLIRNLGIHTLFFLCIGCVARLLLPLEFSYTKAIPNYETYAVVYDFLYLTKHNLGSLSFSFIDILLCSWGIGTLFLMLRLYYKYHSFGKQILLTCKGNTTKDKQITRVVDRLKCTRPYNVRIKISYSSCISIPCGIGIFRKQIVLPDTTYTDNELYFILLHEFTHFYNKDLAVKMFVAILCNLFWWNPFVYLLRRNLDETLEMKCDLTLASELDQQSVADYLSAILSVLKKAPKQHFPTNAVPTTKLAEAHKQLLLQKRFQLVVSSKKAGMFRKPFLIYVCFLSFGVLFFLSSYLYILQPGYQPLPTDIITPAEYAVDPDSFELTPENSYLIQDFAGQYYMVFPPNYSREKISNEYAQMLLDSGFHVREDFKIAFK